MINDNFFKKGLYNMIIAFVVVVVFFSIGGTLTATPDELARIDAATKNQNVCISAEGEDDCVDHAHLDDE